MVQPVMICPEMDNRVQKRTLIWDLAIRPIPESHTKKVLVSSKRVLRDDYFLLTVNLTIISTR